jgi:hypothetical protein
MNDFVKDETTLGLDLFTVAADEAIAFSQRLLEQIASPALHAQVAAHLDTQAALLSRLTTARRRHGALPQIGDPEHVEIGALLSRLRAFVDEDPQSRAIDAIHDAISDASAKADGALALNLSDDVHAALRSYAASAHELLDALQATGAETAGV